MRTWIAVLIGSLLAFGCAQTPDTTTHRHQIDDLRDQDKDGVINQRDRCLDTPQGVVVDNSGCADWTITQQAKVVTIAFDFDHADLRLDQVAQVDKLVTLLQRYPNANVVLVGDTSSEGTQGYNKALAQRRTHTIRNALVQQGIDVARISEQEFTQITTYTEQLHQRQRRTLAVLSLPQMTTTPKWDIFTSEQNLTSATKVEQLNE